MTFRLWDPRGPIPKESRLPNPAKISMEKITKETAYTGWPRKRMNF